MVVLTLMGAQTEKSRLVMAVVAARRKTPPRLPPRRVPCWHSVRVTYPEQEPNPLESNWPGRWQHNDQRQCDGRVVLLAPGHPDEL